jgi:hypothetical protein
LELVRTARVLLGAKKVVKVKVQPSFQGGWDDLMKEISDLAQKMEV